MGKVISGGASSGKRKRRDPGTGKTTEELYDTSTFSEVTEATMTADYAGIFPDMNMNEKQALASYTASGYLQLNDVLRNQGYDPEKYPASQVTKKITNLDNLLAKGTLTRNIITHRGFNAPEIEKALASGMIQKGYTITDPGYMSTSINSTKAFSGSIRYKLYIPKGMKGLYVGKKSSVSHEQEFLLPRGTKVRVRGYKQVGNQWHVDVDVLP